jgi:hypothetical protein
MRMNLASLVPLLLALTLCSCASTSLKHTWKSPGYSNGPVQNVAVLTVDERVLLRQAFENRFVAQLKEHGQAALATFDLLSLPEIKADKQAAASRLSQAGADSVLVVRLMDRQTLDRQVRATPAAFVPEVNGFDTYDWHSYYSIAFTDMGTTWSSSRQDIFLDSSLYDLQTGKRLWADGGEIPGWIPPMKEDLKGSCF